MKRQCLWISASQDPKIYGGYVPSLVVENEPGHSPLLGKGVGASPWTWGMDLKQAQEVCDKYNQDKLGLSKEECLQIVGSSMAVTRPSFVIQRQS